MSTDDFEKRLERQTIKRVPSEWRSEILHAAQSAQPSRPDRRLSWLSTLNPHLSTLLWPCPQAWAGLAVAWLVILLLNLPSTEEPGRMTRDTRAPSAEELMVLSQQRRLFVELIKQDEPLNIDRSKPRGPRSMRRQEEWMG